MSNLSFQSSDQRQDFDTVEDENFENDDLIKFQHDSKMIILFYSQLTKYSKHIREAYLFSDVINRFSHDIHKLQDELQLLPENVYLFFQLLNQNYNINEDLTLTYIQCIDLLKISKFLEVRKLTYKIKQYIKARNFDVDFIIQMIQYNVKTQTETDNQQIKISNEVESLLSSKINECFSNAKFKELPIEIIYRIIEKSSVNEINSNKLYDMIVKSLSRFCVLFQFLELQKLSKDRLTELCEMYSKSNENTRHYFDYLKCNLNLINEMNNRKKNLEEMNDEQQNKMKDLEKFIQNHFNDSEKINVQIQNQLNNSEKINAQLQIQLNEQQNKMKELETLLQKQFNEQLQNQINYSKQLENQISQLQNKLTSSEKEIIDINKQLNEIFPIKGQIIASVEKGLLINAEINLKTKGSTIDTTKSKMIISTSDAKYLGSEAYENGEPITSLHIKTTFVCKPGIYYVRCIVFNSEGESNEILSNSVTTSGNILTFDYEGKQAEISLPQGQYMLEVWGAKGGDGTGNGLSDKSRRDSIVKGGLGGYSRGILNLKKQEKIYVFVGGQGSTSNSSEGSSTKGGFPDGGGTITGIYKGCTTVPRTGGGSTSIRIGNETNYSRVIVAGGGGGASGCTYFVDTGGFGGGQEGGDCYFMGKLQSEGAGTVKGSTGGFGHKEGHNNHGNPGEFGRGAAGKYSQGCTSGGGGGGGWYGGGGGGFGYCAYCSSGGGGSGWVFTQSNFEEFQSGDSANASKFALKNTYYLTDCICVAGDKEFPRPDGNGNERGHPGNGYAKITLI